MVPALLRHVTLFLTVGDANEAYYRNYGVLDERMVRSPFPIDVRLYDPVLADRDAELVLVFDLRRNFAVDDFLKEGFHKRSVGLEVNRGGELVKR